MHLGGVQLKHIARAPGKQRGAETVEFAIVVFLFFSILLAIYETATLMFYYNAVARSAYEGARYAMVGHYEPPIGGCVDTSNPTDAQVEACVAGLNNTSIPLPSAGRVITASSHTDVPARRCVMVSYTFTPTGDFLKAVIPPKFFANTICMPVIK